MYLHSLGELKKFTQIILSDSKIDLKTINKHTQNSSQNTLVLLTDEQLPKSKKLFENKRKNISFKLFYWSLLNHKYHERWHSNKLSIKNSEFIYKKLLEENKLLINFILKLYSSGDIAFGFKKSLAIQLKKYYEVIKIYELIKEYNSNIIPVVEKRKYHIIKKLIEKNIFEEMNSDFDRQVFFHRKNYIDKKLFLQISIFIFYPLYALLTIKKFTIQRIKKNIGIRIYKDGIGLNQDGFNVDWILNNDFFKKENAIFVIEDNVKKSFIKNLKTKKYNFHKCLARKPIEKCSLYFFIKIIIFYIPLGILTSPIIFFSNSLLKDEAITAWIKFFAWKNFTSIFKIKSYLSYHNYTSDHIYRNIFLKKINCLTAMYKHTHSENVFDYKKKELYAYVIYMYLYYDIEFHWSKCSIEMSKSNESKSRKYLISGPIWSSTEFLDKKHQINFNKNKKLISLFTTSFGGTLAVNSFNSHVKFLLFAIEIVKKYADTKIIFKSKKDFELYQINEKTKELAKKLLSFKNLEIVNPQVFSPAIYRASEVVISMAFCSTGMEAMCLGAKSFYVDPINTYKNSYFDNFEKLVSHSNEEALESLEYWMKLDHKNISLKYKKIFEVMGIEKANNASEIIRNRIIENIQSKNL